MAARCAPCDRDGRPGAHGRRTPAYGRSGHLGGDEGLSTGAGDDHHTGVVDDAQRTRPIHEADGVEQELLGFETGVARIVLDEQQARIGQHQTRTLRSHGLAAEAHAVRRGVVLHLLARTEPVFPGALRWCAQPGVSDPTRERAVGDLQIILGGEQLLHARDVALRTREGGLQRGQADAVGRRLFGCLQRCT